MENFIHGIVSLLKNLEIIQENIKRIVNIFSTSGKSL